MTYVNGLPLTLGNAKLLAAHKQVTTQVKRIMRLEGAGLVCVVCRERKRLRRANYKEVITYKLTAAGELVKVNLK